MTNTEILVPLKIDLEISNNDLDDYLCGILDMARDRISEEGITLTQDVGDGMLLQMYAAYIYRSRRTSGDMPRMLRYALNNRLFSEKGKANGTTTD